MTSFGFDDMKVKIPIYLSYCSPDILKNLFLYSLF